ncbi:MULTISPECIES: MurR/RpiR family transcriptional regulator [unclassified Thomasclavelia]|uniref:MurR/RpiR family transcriptional regulator n=1 Tax=Candidatus Erysipelatoclostridium merdavium TaxID=2838566 RepID=A0A9D1XK47_9FIRM|nr:MULTISPECIES: MurR/RpiR family transcriptional regulator [unclassified Thomasclavelia]OUP72263.1 RpiR family transcriptional regulator [Erysipelatoclostridium sp. An173]OUQ05375.1 RpiR family transcriptional regulator [Erysipelatoclostridium sp. An15]HIX80542.1 MurR/RpiR family transcriptional regulator [Candidatus Erysipelatoclostridium merdavium]
MNIFSKLDNLTDLTANEQTLVDYMKNNPERFVNMSADEISAACFVSIPTIYRLCKKLKLNGLSQLKMVVSNSIRDYMKEKNGIDYNYPFSQNETQYQITVKMKELYEQTLTTLNNLIDLEQLRLIALALKKAKYIDIYTSAGNIYFAENFKFQMSEIGVVVNVPVEQYQQSLAAAASNEEHVAIVVSFEGRGMLVEQVMTLLKKNKTPIVLISSTTNKTMIQSSDYNLYLNPNENHYNKISSFSTRLSLLYLLDCIYTCYFKLDYDKNVKYKTETYMKMTKE